MESSGNSSQRKRRARLHGGCAEQSRKSRGSERERREKEREDKGGKSQWQRNSLSKKLDAQLDDEIERAQGKEMPSPSAKEC